MKPTKACELCSGEAALHCESDSAFLCWACDARVHGANFLVARHARRVLCVECGAHHLPVSGPGFLPVRFLCHSCNLTKQADEDSGVGGSPPSDSESSSCCSSSLRSSMTSSCVSSAESGAKASTRDSPAAFASLPGPIKAACYAISATESEGSNPGPTRRRRRRGRTAAPRDFDSRTDAVLLNWCRRIGLADVCVPAAASYARGAGARRVSALPFRAAVWFAAKMSCGEATQGGRRGAALLRRLEACSGVPGRLVVAAEARLSGAVRQRRRRLAGDEDEGWAECNGCVRRRRSRRSKSRVGLKSEV